jgi:hypothetical protein
LNSSGCTFLSFFCFVFWQDNMLFTHEKNADHFDRLSYGNLRGLDASGNSEECSFGNGCKDSSSVPAEKFSFPWLPVENCQSATLDLDKRPLSDVKPCQVACKRPKQTDHNTLLYSLEEYPFTSEAKISASGFLLHLPSGFSSLNISIGPEDI